MGPQLPASIERLDGEIDSTFCHLRSEMFPPAATVRVAYNLAIDDERIENVPVTRENARIALREREREREWKSDLRKARSSTEEA